jgi:thymidine kinase
MPKIGWIELIFGSMYCGKSEELIRRLKRVKIANQKYQLFKPALDDRYASNHVVTHEGNEIKKSMEEIVDFHVQADLTKRKKLTKELLTKLSGSMKAIVVKDSSEILSLVDEESEVIGIDEAQFFDNGLINVIEELTRSGKRVIVAGLDMYASGEAWGVMPILACKAKFIDKLHAVCSICGSDAQFSYKINNNEDNTTSAIDVGSNGKYIALCGNCRFEQMNK